MGGTFAGDTLTSEDDIDGYLIQASYSANGHRVVLSHGETDTGAAQENELDSIAYFYDVNSYLKLIAEYDMAEDTAGNETDQIAVGAAVFW